MENEELIDIPELEGDSRNFMQRVAMFAIYDALTYASMGESVDIEHIVSSLCQKPYDECDVFVKGILIYTLKNLEHETEVFNNHMNKWTFDRLNRVEQAILLLAYTHFFYVDETVDKGVVIDLAVRMAKSYLDPAKDYKFVNAVLDKVLVR